MKNGEGVDDGSEVTFSNVSDSVDADDRHYQILDQLSVVRAHGQMIARVDRKGRPLRGDALYRRMDAIDAAVVQIAMLLRTGPVGARRRP